MMTLASFGLSEERGFLPHNDPLESLPQPFAAWERCAKDLPKLLVSDVLRPIIEALPPFPTEKLPTRDELHRAMVLLSYLGHAYVFGRKPTAQQLPSVLAKPWFAVAERLGRLPVLSYESYALDNWKRIDPSQPVRLGNIALVQNFLAGIDEEWFILIHVDIEGQAGQALQALVDGKNAVSSADQNGLLANLKTLGSTMGSLHSSLVRMTEHCDPYIYYHRVRPYIHGWKNNPSLPNGMTYEGVDAYQGKGQFFRGETGAQSSIIPAVDGFLGIHHHDDPLKAYLMEMRSYMPPEHKRFIEAMETTPSVRDFVKGNFASLPELKDQYNECVTWTEKFRSLHLEYAISYIAKQSQVDPSNPSAIGTGGTPFVQYLTKHRDETGTHLL